MNETNKTQVVKDAYAKFQNRDIDGLMNLFSEDIHWKIPEVAGSPLINECRGHEEVGKFFAQLDEAEDITHFEPKEFIAQNDRVVVLGNYRATIKATGRDFDSDWVQIFTVRDGKITSFLEFFDTAAAERAYQKAATA